MTPTVSITMPCYNGATHLHQSVSSVLTQTFSNWELLIVDDGSKDDSWLILQTLVATDTRIHIYQQTNAGWAAARNYALQKVRGIYTACLDADDARHPEFLEAMVASLEIDPGIGIAYCGWQNLGLGGERDDPFIPPELKNSNKTESLLKDCRWPIYAALTHTQTVRDAGGLDISFSSCNDFDLWLRLGATHRLARVPRVLAYYHHYGGKQITNNRSRIALNHWRTQQKYLRANPAIRAKLGSKRVRELTDGELLKRGYVSYWKRDLAAARQIFHAVMAGGYGNARDWKYMFPALLPVPFHQALIRLMELDQNEKPLSESAVPDGWVA